MPLKRIKKIIDKVDNIKLKEINIEEIKKPFYNISAFGIFILFCVLIFSIVRMSFLGEVDANEHLYFEIVFLLLLAVLAEVAVFYLKAQNVIVLMIIGILISPSFLNFSWNFFNLPGEVPKLFLNEHIIEIFAQLGAIILLFKVGLHSKIEKIFSKENLLVAFLGVLVPFFMGYLYAFFLSKNFVYSMFVGAALSATSVGITVAILKQMKVLDKKFSEVIIGAAVLDDILSLLLLSVVVNLSNSQGEIFKSVSTTFFTAVVFVLGAIISGKYVVDYLDKKELGDKRFLLSIALMLFFAYVAEIIKLSAIVGAFLAGLIINRSRHYKELEEKTYGLEFLFMPIFFISLGILVDVKSLFIYFIPILIITLIAIFSKIIACGGMSFLSKLNFKDSLIVGIGMVPRGEVALIIASLGLANNVLSVKEYSIISAMALLTSFFVPSVLSYLIKKLLLINKNK
ncbi:MAG: cation:proton antiporter [Candidatus Woesearchaeota archaeon]